MEMMIHAWILKETYLFTQHVQQLALTVFFNVKQAGIAAITVNPPGTAPAQACDDAWMWGCWIVKMFRHFRQGDFKP